VAIIFVSHNLHAINHVCSRAITLEKGQMLYDGEVERAIDVYRESLIELDASMEKMLRAGTGEIRIRKLEVLNAKDIPQDEFETGDYIKLRLHYQAIQPVVNPVINLAINVLYDQQVTGIRTDVDGMQVGTLEGEGSIDLVIPNFNLLPNVYTFDAVMFHPDGFTFYDRVNKAAYLKVRGGLRVNGTAFLPHQWDLSGLALTLESSSQAARIDD